MTDRVCVLGLDGGTFDLLGPWIEEGMLPNIKDMIEHGVSGELTSSVPPVTAPAWSTFITGKNPGKHGVYDFMIPERNSYQHHPVNAQLRDGKDLWDIMSDNGARVVVSSVPTTYPPHEVNGALISGFLTPAGKKDFIYPQGLLDEIEAKFGPYPLFVKTPIGAINLTDANTDTFLTESVEVLEYRFNVLHYLLDKVDPHFLMLHIFESDLICHWLWHILDESHPKHDRAGLEKFGGRILDYFQRFDAEVGRLMETLGEDATLLIMSDHGFGPLHGFIGLNMWLLAEGYLALKKRPITKLKHLLWRAGITTELLFKVYAALTKRGIKLDSERLNRMVEDLDYAKFMFGDVDWARTRAFSNLSLGQIAIHVRGRWPQGCVSPGDEYDSLRNEIVEKLRDLRDPRTGKRIDGQVFLSEDVYSGQYFDQAPDITYLPLDSNYLATYPLFFPSNRVISDAYGHTATHRMNGILIGKGKALRRGATTSGANIVDLAPSILYLMGIGIPRDMDGEVLEEMFTQEFLGSNRIEHTDVVSKEAEQILEMSPKDEDEIMNRLKGLGYIR